MKTKKLNKEGIISIFKLVDKKLKEPTKIVILGAASLLLLDIIQRSTADIDIANVLGAFIFQKISTKLGYLVDIVSVSSTVDFDSAEKYEVFQGKNLRVYSVNEKDLIKLKLERFRKQDPADINAIIKKTSLVYKDYKEIVTDAVKDYVGNPDIFILSILQVAEDHYTEEELIDLKKTFKPFAKSLNMN